MIHNIIFTRIMNKIIIVFVLYKHCHSQNSVPQIYQMRAKKIKTHQTIERRQTQNNLANANDYKHFLQCREANNDHIKWAFKLRQHQPINLQRSVSSEPFSVYFKTIEAKKQRHQNNDFPASVNYSELEHLTRLQKIPASASLIVFSTTLRNNPEIQNRKKGKKWIPFPIKDRKQFPKLINSDSLKQKIIRQQNMSFASNWQQECPKFNQKVIGAKNINLFKHMFKGKINLPCLGWQTNLRQY